MTIMTTPDTARGAFRRWARTMLAHRRGGPGVHQDAALGHQVYQTSTIGALLDGVYDGDVTIGELLQHGDFGLGTFNHLDGEMVILDGVCYHLRADGSASVAGHADLTPFAVVTWFKTDRAIKAPAGSDRAAVTALIDKSVPTKNLIYAIRITGSFAEVRTRTVMEQRPPYPPLTAAAEGQQETTLRDVMGTLAGYRTPDYEQAINVAGYHLHFIDREHLHGGHVLDFRLGDGQIDIGIESDLHLSLPGTPQFRDANLLPANIAAQVGQAEGGPGAP
jgi:acetolactate decarboxylase